MFVEKAQKTKSVDYGDLKNHAFLWQKALILTPLWAIPAIPIVGFIFRGMGSVPMQVGYGATVCVLVAYFLEDLLKRKIRMDSSYLFFGYRAIPIESIVDVDVLYKKGKFLPNHLCITQASGRKLKLSLDGLTNEGAATLLKHLEACNSNLKTSPVLNTLIKCRNQQRKREKLADKIVLQYQSRMLIDESIDVFKKSAKSWTRVGPLLLFFILGPIWIYWLSSLFVCLQPHALSQLETLNLHQFLLQILEGIRGSAFKGAEKLIDASKTFSQHQIISIAATTCLAGFFAYITRLLLNPNIVFADTKGLKLSLNLGELSLPAATVKWNDLQSLQLKKTNNGPGIIQLCKNQNKKIELNLAYLSVEDRGSLLKHIERFAPQCQIDPNLSQAMLPKSEMSYTEIWLQSLTQTPERQALEPLEPGQVIGGGRFEVLRSIGVGGQGTAYLCRTLDTEESSQVVLKETIVPVFADSEIRRRSLESFEKEASLLKQLNHPGVVQLMDYFVDDHRAYLVLEHLSGCDLREKVRREGPLSEENARDVALQICEILKFLHANSIIHRDFTPDNLIFDAKGKLKVIDFNVAQNSLASSTGTIVGKHAYLPPEQFRGKASKQSDLYAFGATLFYLVTGQDPEPISQSSPLAEKVSVSAAFDQIVKKATSLDQKKRFQTIEEMENALLMMDQAVANFDDIKVSSSEQIVSAISSELGSENSTTGTESGSETISVTSTKDGSEMNSAIRSESKAASTVESGSKPRSTSKSEGGSEPSMGVNSETSSDDPSRSAAIAIKIKNELEVNS